jgi:hypothetical protein
MAQKRKKRTIIFEIKITVFTDFMEKHITDLFEMFCVAVSTQEKTRGRNTEIVETHKTIYG